MLRMQELVFDEFVLGAACTGVQHAEVLALGDRLALQAILGAGGAGGRFTATVEHAADGIHWIPRNPSREIDVTLDGLPRVILTGDPDPPPASLRYMRVSFTVTDSRTEVRVRLYAALRDNGKGAYSSCPCQGDEEDHDSDGDPRDTAAHRGERAQHGALRDAGHGHPGSGRSGERHAVGVATPALAIVHESRPHDALAQLEQHLSAQHDGVPEARLRHALGALPDKERADVMAYLSRLSEATGAAL